jgi:NADH dehydrogenase [ubiquinone] 1 alpha subcomplex assembly factor 5
MTEPMAIFNRRIVRLHRDRAAPHFAEHDFLFREVADRLLERLDDVTRTFPVVLNLDARGDLVGEILGQRGGTEILISCAQSLAKRKPPSVCADEELLPFADHVFDLVVSNLSLHWINDLPGALLQIRRCLKPDGLMIGTMFGGETLKELRSVLSEAEIVVEGGLSPRVSPFADIRDMGGLLQRAGFTLPVVDAETITVSYGDPLKLLKDLRGMGETNAVSERRSSFTRRDTLMLAMDLYRKQFGDDEGRVPATFQVLYLSGWSPAPTQQKPMKPGSGMRSLTDEFS